MKPPSNPIAATSPRIWPAVLALAVLSLIWGYNWVVMKKVLAYADPFDFAALRVLFGALALFVVMVLRRQSLRPVAVGPTIVLGVLQCAIFSALIQWALVEGGAGKTAVIVYVMPFWLLPLAWLFLGERIRGGQWLAIALAAGGLLFVLEPWRLPPDAVSSAIALTAGLVWAVSAVVAKRLRASVHVDLLSLTAWQMLFGAIVLCTFAWWLPTRPIEISTYFIFALAFNAIAASALAWWLWLFVLHRLPAALAGLSALAVPAVGVLSAWVELGERPTPAEGVGMLLIAVALGLISLLALRQRRAAAALARAAGAEALLKER